MARIIRLLLTFLKNPVKFYKVYVLPKYRHHPFIEKRQPLSPPQKQFISKLNRYKINWNKNKQGVVLTQIVEDYEMCIKLANASSALAKIKNANIGLYSQGHFKMPKNAFVRYLLSQNFKTTLDKVFLSFAGKVLYRNTNLYQDQAKISSLFEKIKQNLRSKDDVLNIHIEDIKIGDLICDTYLRFADKPELDVNDPFINDLILQSLNIYFVTKQKITEHKVVALVNSYTTYIYHGIVVRLCLKNNIPVYTIGAYYSLVHKVMKEYPSHANNHFLFKKLFEKLQNNEEIIQKHKALFEKRFAGAIDSATSYMRESAFSNDINSELNGIDWSTTVVVLAHCFFDSPHIYRDLLFADFYDWLTFTLNELSLQPNLTVLVKQHPNGLPQNDPIFEKLKNIYKDFNVKFIDKKTSQLQIINSRPKAIITAYGTAAAEFAYQGFPVLTIYDNPFTAYDFTHIANTKEEYKHLLKDALTLLPKQNQKDIIEYYYMQYFHFLMGRDVNYMLCSKYKGQTFSEEFLIDYLPNMTASYFNQLEEGANDGIELCAWEEAIIKEN